MDIHLSVKKTMVIGILFLLFGLTSSIPSMGTSSQIENTDIQVTTQVCGFIGEPIHTVTMTDSQVGDVTAVFENLKQRVSAAETMEETQEILNDAVIDLHRLNLLPEGMSVEQAQYLVNKASNQWKKTTPVQKLSNMMNDRTGDGSIQNSFCSIVGNASNVHFTKLAKRTTLRLFAFIDYSSANAVLTQLATAAWIVCNQFSLLSDRFLQQPWHHLGVSIYFGNYHFYPYPEWLHPAEGWIETNGLNGKQNISGSFWGQNMLGGWQPQDDWHMNYTWRGCAGFSGLITYVGQDSAYFIGSALYVNIGPNRP